MLFSREAYSTELDESGSLDVGEDVVFVLVAPFSTMAAMLDQFELQNICLSSMENPAF